MSLVRSVARNTAIQVIGKIISTLLGLAAIAMMTRTLGVEKFGWYVTATGFLQFVGILSDFGFTVTVSKMLAEPQYDKQKLLNTSFTLRFLTALLFNGLAPLIILFFPYPAEIKIAVAVVSISFFALSLNQIFIAYFRTALQLLAVTISEILGRIVLVLGIFFVTLTSGAFMPMMWVITLASLVSIAYLWFNCRNIKFGFDKTISRALFITIWPTALTVIFNAFYLQGDRVILPLYVSQSQVGLYGAAYRVLDIVIQIAAIIMGITMPLLTFAWSRNLKDEFKRRYQLSFDLLILCLFPIVAGAIALANPLMQFVAGKEFVASGYVLRYLSWSILGTCFGMIFGHAALAIGRQKQAMWVYLTDAILSVIGYFIFIPRFGLYGAAAMTIFSEFYAGVGLMLITRYYSGAFPKLNSLAKITLASIVMGAAVYLLQPMSLVLLIIIGGAIYTALIFILKTISVDTFKAILSHPVADDSQI